MSVKELKEFILAGGGQHADCVEKADLVRRAQQVTASLAKPPASSSPAKAKPPPASSPSKAQPADSDSELSSDSEEEDVSTGELQVSNGFAAMTFLGRKSAASSGPSGTASASASPTTTPPKARGSTVFRAKKFMTSRMGETRVGQATVLKLIGDDGEAVITALKSVSEKLESPAIAKRRKRDSLSLLLKVYNLFKRKDLRPESFHCIQSDAQLLAEMFVRDAMSTTRARGRRTVTHLENYGMKTKLALIEILSPHLREKNVERLRELLTFYSSHAFLNSLLNSPALVAECSVIEKATGGILVSLPASIVGERERSSLAKMKSLLSAIPSKAAAAAPSRPTTPSAAGRKSVASVLRLDNISDYPHLILLFQELLDLEMGLAHKHALRFFLVVRDFEKISSRSIMKIRAPKIFEKFLTAEGENSVTDAVSEDALNQVQQMIQSGLVGMSCFQPCLVEVRKNLDDDFATLFLTSEELARYRDKLETDAAALEHRLKEQGAITSATSASGVLLP